MPLKVITNFSTKKQIAQAKDSYVGDYGFDLNLDVFLVVEWVEVGVKLKLGLSSGKIGKLVVKIICKNCHSWIIRRNY